MRRKPDKPHSVKSRLPRVDGGENPRIDGAVVSLAASSGLVETMMVRG